MTDANTRLLRTGDIDLVNTLQMIGIYGSDPTFRKGPGHFAKANLTPDGSGTLRLTWSGDGDVHAEAWGGLASPFRSGVNLRLDHAN